MLQARPKIDIEMPCGSVLLSDDESYFYFFFLCLYMCLLDYVKWEEEEIGCLYDHHNVVG